MSSKSYLICNADTASLRMCSKLCFLPVIMNRDIAPDGTVFLGWLTFKPIPTMVKSKSLPISFDSTSIPQSFLDRTRISLGHLTPTLTFETFRTASTTAFAAMIWIMPILAGGIFGLSITENQRPPGGELQHFPDLPWPLV